MGRFCKYKQCHHRPFVSLNRYWKTALTSKYFVFKHNQIWYNQNVLPMERAITLHRSFKKSPKQALSQVWCKTVFNENGHADGRTERPTDARLSDIWKAHKIFHAKGAECGHLCKNCIIDCLISLLVIQNVINTKTDYNF